VLGFVSFPVKYSGLGTGAVFLWMDAFPDTNKQKVLTGRHKANDTEESMLLPLHQLCNANTQFTDNSTMCNI